MSREDSHDAVERVNDAVEDGGGCTEAWEALSSMRDGDSNRGRRGFLTRVGIAIGAIPLGTAAVDNAVAKNKTRRSGSAEHSTESLRGRGRGQLLRRANRSEQVEFAADQLGKRGGVSQVYKYEVEGSSGYGVTYGAENDGPTIRYYESAALSDSGVKTIGAVPESDGILATDAEAGVVFDIGETTRLSETMRYLRKNDEYSEFKSTLLDDKTLRSEESVLVRTVTGVERPSGIYIPVEKDGRIVDRVVVTGPGTPSANNIGEYSIVQPTTEEEFTTQDNDAVVCGPFGVCVNYCTVLCSSLAGIAAGGCTAACSGTVVGIPISPACGAICAGVAGGTCYPTCVNQVN